MATLLALCTRVACFHAWIYFVACPISIHGTSPPNIFVSTPFLPCTRVSASCVRNRPRLPRKPSRAAQAPDGWSATCRARPPATSRWCPGWRSTPRRPPRRGRGPSPPRPCRRRCWCPCSSWLSAFLKSCSVLGPSLCLSDVACSSRRTLCLLSLSLTRLLCFAFGRGVGGVAPLITCGCSVLQPLGLCGCVGYAFVLRARVRLRVALNFVRTLVVNHFRARGVRALFMALVDSED